MDSPELDEVELSRLLFEAREEIAMWADVVEHRTAKRDRQLDDLLSRIDAYRARRGWDLDGFGHETCPQCGGGRLPHGGFNYTRLRCISAQD